MYFDVNSVTNLIIMKANVLRDDIIGESFKLIKQASNRASMIFLLAIAIYTSLTLFDFSHSQILKTSTVTTRNYTQTSVDQ